MFPQKSPAMFIKIYGDRWCQIIRWAAYYQKVHDSEICDTFTTIQKSAGTLTAACRPPSTRTCSPVMSDAASDARNAITLATSSGWPARPSGWVSFDLSRNCKQSSSFIENITFFHPKLGLDVCPRVDNQTSDNTLQDLTQPLVEKSLSASYPPMGIGASFWWWDALPHQPVQFGLVKRHWSLETSSSIVKFPPPYLIALNKMRLPMPTLDSGVFRGTIRLWPPLATKICLP